MAGHAGNWDIARYGRCIEITSPASSVAQLITDARDNAEMVGNHAAARRYARDIEQNALLIAAAPQLLNALARRALESVGMEGWPIWDDGRPKGERGQK